MSHFSAIAGSSKGSASPTEPGAATLDAESKTKLDVTTRRVDFCIAAKEESRFNTVLTSTRFPIRSMVSAFGIARCMPIPCCGQGLISYSPFGPMRWFSVAGSWEASLKIIPAQLSSLKLSAIEIRRILMFALSAAASRVSAAERAVSALGVPGRCAFVGSSQEVFNVPRRRDCESRPALEMFSRDLAQQASGVTPCVSITSTKSWKQLIQQSARSRKQSIKSAFAETEAQQEIKKDAIAESYERLSSFCCGRST